ncbi:bifunctional 2-C-methyl-D-erythritol 4-phosphate cytidylyltransferase/2-C-methyl-D-erythritol 2,4-cyclodiphosphate synthase [Sulfurospirillum sp. 1612]|uniref:bifunctional 2-C-methyl-D-erythritol 4-phosphate cytidylyltransferase/2-C-methyl-D-erythritol 2,4-cyclodiphosphate synthase n=1 Tax=Sulfurospirillum sp. 1612 TaxID=3094835 RepID=UPI002F94770C
MPDLSLVMLGAGNSSRFEHTVKKQWLRFDDTPLWLYATHNIAQKAQFAKIIIVAHHDELAYMKRFEEEYLYVEGGNSRQESLKNALQHVDTPFVLVSDIARVCISEGLLQRILAQKDFSDIVVPFLHVSDTVVYDETPIARDKVKLIQTPQLSRTDILKSALNTDITYTDDSSAIKAIGGSVSFVEGENHATKLTRIRDLAQIPCKYPPSKDIFVGNGFDVHEFETAKPMMLGGVKIRDDFGFRAHSDGDVAIHALIDALLGAMGAGDVGELFPDHDDRFKNIDSKTLLTQVVTFLTQVGFEIVNCDITIIAQTPKIGDFKREMARTIAAILNIKPIHVNIKATTTEHLGFIGRKEGVGVNATATLKYIDWTHI